MIKHKDPSEYHTEADKTVLNEIKEAKAAKKKFSDEIAAGDAAAADGKSTEPDPNASVKDLLKGTVITSPTWSERRNSLLRSVRKFDNHIDELSVTAKKLRYQAELKLAAEIKPQADALEKRLVDAAVAFHDAHLEYWSNKRALLNAGIGIYGNFLSNADD